MTDCIVVGGGLIGMLTARYLHDAGATVLLLEQGELGHESSWAGGGILSPLYPWRYPDAVTRLARYSQQLYPAFAQARAEETGIDPQWTPSGLLVLDTQAHESALGWARGAGMAMELLERADLRACEPALAQAFESGL